MAENSALLLKQRRGIISLLFGVVIALATSGSQWIEETNNDAYGLLLSTVDTTHREQQSVVIGIGDPSLKRFREPLVFWHHYLSQVIRGAAEAGAGAIALDIVPAVSLEHLAPHLDRELMQALKDSRESGTKIILGFKSGKSGVSPHRKFTFAADNLCSLNLYPDRDGTIRRYKLLVTGNAGERKVSSVSQCMASPSNRASPTSGDRSPYIDYRIPLPETYEFADVYDWTVNHQTDRLHRAFAGKLVYIGITSFQLPDHYPVPIQLAGQDGRLSGVLIHALATETLLQDHRLENPGKVGLWIVLLLSALFSGLCFILLSPLRASLFLAFAALISAFAAYQAFAAYIVLPMGSLAASLLIPAVFTSAVRYATEYLQFRRLQRYFSSYVHPHVLKEIIEHPEQVAFEGEKIVATVMFTDICNFTSFSENMEAERLVEGLNRYFEQMTQSVIEHGGYLNRFLGDGILAIFGAPNRLPDDGAPAAVSCAIDMRRRLDNLNRERIFRGIDLSIDIGIGIHTGEAVVGNIGCQAKMDYSIMGDTVNLASRIEGKTRQYDAGILISSDTYGRVRDKVEVERIGTTSVKGRKQEVELYEVLRLL